VGAALFDLDGTLTDPKDGITRSVHYALKAQGLLVEDLDTLVSYIGPPLHDSFVRLGRLSPADATTAVASYREYFVEKGIFENRVFPGVPECLAALRSNGWRLAVATSKPTMFAQQILDHFSLSDYFEFVAGSELDGTRVHKHEVISHALEGLDLSPSSTSIMIGDREHDIFGARRVGLRAVGVMWGYGSRSELVAAGADRLVEDVTDLASELELLRSVDR